MNTCPHCQGPLPEPVPRFGMTERQASALVFIRAFVAVHEFGPSFEEIKDYLGLRSKSGVARIIDALEFRGYIRRSYGRHRSIALVGAT